MWVLVIDLFRLTRIGLKTAIGQKHPFFRSLLVLLGHKDTVENRMRSGYRE
jgi:hypothetical protein